MNKIILIGRLTKDPETKTIAGSNTAVTTFVLAVDRNFKNKDGQREADFINIVSYGKLAETMGNYLKKGRMVALSGRLEIKTYDGNDGQKKYFTDVVVEDFQFLEKKDGGGQSSNKGASDDDFAPIDGDNDIPF